MYVSRGLCYPDMSESFELTLRELYRIYWYDTLFFLAGACLSFADPITDILVLVEFYRADHLTWFGVGLAFVILPCLMYPFVRHFSIESAARRDMSATLKTGFKLKANDLICGFHPFSPALARSQAFLLCFKNFKDLWNRRREYSKTAPPPRPAWASNKTEAVFLHNKLAPLFEALLESAPQIIIQLYAIGVQEEPVKIIQMISLPVSILNLFSTFTIADGMLHDDEIGALNLKHKLLLFITQLFIVTSRLFAIAFFMASYKWWIICVLVVHSITLLSTDTVWFYRSGKLTAEAAIVAPCFSILNWLRDDLSLSLYFDAEAHDENTRKHLIRIQCLCNILFAVENLIMILVFYFDQTFIAWYSLPVLVCMGLLSCIGATIRIFHFKFLRRKYTPCPMYLEVLPDHELTLSATTPVEEQNTTAV